MSNRDVARTAREYARDRGLFVFPTHGKIPATEHGFKDAENQFGVVAVMFSRAAREVPEGELGIGLAPGPSGYVVLDIDVKDGATGREDLEDLIARHGDFTKDAPEVLTPSGGSHFYFRRPEGVTIDNTKLAPGIDVRCDSGYVLLPGSPGYDWELSSPEIEDAPDFPMVLLDERRKIERDPSVLQNAEGKYTAGSRYDHGFRTGTSMKFKGNPMSVIEAAIRRINDELYEPPLSEARLLKLLSDIEKSKPINPTTGETRARLRAVEPASDDGDDTDLGEWLVSASSVHPNPNREWLPGWDHMIPCGCATVIAGDPKRGKSTMTRKIAADLTKLGRRVLIFSAEDSTEAIVRHLRLEGANLDLVSIVAGVPYSGNDFLRRVQATVLKLQPALVIIDPYMSYVSSDKMNTTGAREMIDVFHALGSQMGVTVIIVHHLTKAEGGSVRERVLGSTSIVAAARATIVVGSDPNRPAAGSAAALAIANYANPRTVKARGFRIIDSDGPDEARVEWTGESSLTADDIISAKQDFPSAIERAANWLLKALADGPVEASELEALVNDEPFSWATVKRAKPKVAKSCVGDDYGKWALLEEGDEIEEAA